LKVEVDDDHAGGKLRLKVTDGGGHSANGSHRRAVINVANAYGPHRHTTLNLGEELTVETRHSGGWYDIALTSKSDHSFAYELAGRLESGHALTSDPQLGRAKHESPRHQSERRATPVA
jgi:hypothetical protein